MLPSRHAVKSMHMSWASARLVTKLSGKPWEARETSPRADDAPCHDEPCHICIVLSHCEKKVAVVALNTTRRTGPEWPLNVLLRLKPGRDIGSAIAAAASASSRGL
jgi:hypothetical protein